MIPRYASYRDPRSSVAAADSRVIRTFDEEGAKAFLAARSAGLLDDFQSRGLIPKYEVVSESPLRVTSDLVPFVSYPEEWTPEMLRDAGLLTLEISRIAWATGFHLRDATAYNIVFDGPRPLFVDLGSVGAGLTPLWTAYGQFCDHFLSPLLIDSHLDVPFNGLWNLEGISVDVAARLLRGSNRWRKGVLTNVTLRARLESKHSGDALEARHSTRRELSLSPLAVDGLMQKMERTLKALSFSDQSTWAGYEGDNSYDDAAETARDFAIQAFAEKTPHNGVAVDIGANAGRHSAVLARSFDKVVAVDLDRVAVEIHRQRLVAGDVRNVFPIVANMARPTPGQGFMNLERMDLLSRLKGANATTWMAVIHHLAIANGIPLAALARMAVEISPRHLIEFVDLTDPMAQLLSATKGGEHHDYSQPAFEAAFGELFRLTRLDDTIQGRFLYEAQV